MAATVIQRAFRSHLHFQRTLPPPFPVTCHLVWSGQVELEGTLGHTAALSTDTGHRRFLLDETLMLHGAVGSPLGLHPPSTFANAAEGIKAIPHLSLQVARFVEGVFAGRSSGVVLVGDDSVVRVAIGTDDLPEPDQMSKWDKGGRGRRLGLARRCMADMLARRAPEQRVAFSAFEVYHDVLADLVTKEPMGLRERRRDTSGHGLSGLSVVSVESMAQFEDALLLALINATKRSGVRRSHIFLRLSAEHEKDRWATLELVLLAQKGLKPNMPSDPTLAAVGGVRGEQAKINQSVLHLFRLYRHLQSPALEPGFSHREFKLTTLVRDSLVEDRYSQAFVVCSDSALGEESARRVLQESLEAADAARRLGRSKVLAHQAGPTMARTPKRKEEQQRPLASASAPTPTHQPQPKSAPTATPTSSSSSEARIRSLEVLVAELSAREAEAVKDLRIERARQQARMDEVLRAASARQAELEDKIRTQASEMERMREKLSALGKKAGSPAPGAGSPSSSNSSHSRQMVASVRHILRSSLVDHIEAFENALGEAQQLCEQAESSSGTVAASLSRMVGHMRVEAAEIADYLATLNLAQGKVSASSSDDLLALVSLSTHVNSLLSAKAALIRQLLFSVGGPNGALKPKPLFNSSP